MGAELGPDGPGWALPASAGRPQPQGPGTACMHKPRRNCKKLHACSVLSVEGSVARLLSQSWKAM